MEWPTSCNWYPVTKFIPTANLTELILKYEECGKA